MWRSEHGYREERPDRRPPEVAQGNGAPAAAESTALGPVHRAVGDRGYELPLSRWCDLAGRVVGLGGGRPGRGDGAAGGPWMERGAAVRPGPRPARDGLHAGRWLPGTAGGLR